MRDKVIIYSHPRSGLHLLSLGLYAMTEHLDEKSEYKTIWGSKYLPSYVHYFTGITSKQADSKFDRHILLLRNFITLKTTKAKSRPYGLQLSGYARQIRRFDNIKSPKMVVYYEDLKEQDDLFFTIADFLDIKYNLKADFSKIRKYVHDMYELSGHQRSTKSIISELEKKETQQKMINETGLVLFEKYLARYNLKNKEQQ